MPGFIAVLPRWILHSQPARYGSSFCFRAWLPRWPFAWTRTRRAAYYPVKYGLVPRPSLRKFANARLSMPPNTQRSFDKESEARWLRNKLERNQHDQRSWLRLARIQQTSEQRRIVLKEALEKNSHSPALWNALGLLESQECGNMAEAEKVYGEAFQSVQSGNRGALYHALGVLRRRQDRVEESISLFKEGITDHPRYVSLYLGLADTYRKQGQTDLAREVYEKGARIEPGHAALFRSFAVFEESQGNPEASFRCWERAAEINPYEIRTWFRLCQAASTINATVSEEIEILRRGLAYNRGSVKLRIAISAREESTGAISEARSVLEPLAYRDNSQILRVLARLEYRQGNYEQARENFRRALSIGQSQENEGASKATDPDHLHEVEGSDCAKTLHSWALMEKELGCHDSARQLLLQGIKMSSENPTLWNALGQLENEAKNFEAARSAFQRAVTTGNPEPRIWYNWANSEISAKDTERAEELLQRGISASEAFIASHRSAQKSVHNMLAIKSSKRTESECLRLLAELHERAGRLQQAEEALRKTVEVFPSSIVGWRSLAELVGRLKGPAEMRKVYEEALDKVAGGKFHSRLLHYWALEEKGLGKDGRVRAKELLRKSTRISPQNLAAWLSLALVEKSDNRISEACSVYKQASEYAAASNPNTPFLFQSWGRMEEIERSDVASARKVFQQGTSLVPFSPTLWEAYGLLEERAGRIEKARECYSKSVDVDPKYGSGWQSLALLEARRRRYTQAAEIFEKATRNDSQNASLWASWGIMEAKHRKDLACGRRLLRQATTVDPKFSGIWAAWGGLEAGAGNKERAYKLYLKAAELNERSPNAWHALASLEAQSPGDGRKAISFYKKALSCNPAHDLSYQGWALLAEKLGNIAEARRILELGIKEVRNSYNLYQVWALIEERQGNIERAKELFQTGLNLWPTKSNLWVALAMLHKKHGNIDECRKLLKEGCSVAAPKYQSAALYSAWGTTEFEQGNYELARQLFRKGININPSHAPVWKAYASMESSLGNVSKAEELRAAAAGVPTNADILITDPDGFVEPADKF